MIDQVRVVTAPFKKFFAPNSVTMQGLWRLAAWGATAACALLIAVMTTRGEVGARRAVIVLSSLGGNSLPLQRSDQLAVLPVRPFDAQSETRRLSEAVRGLAAQSDELRSRVAVVEHTVDDVTGSITDMSAAKAANRGLILPPWPDQRPPAPPTAADVAAVLSPFTPMPTEYGVDIGSALSIPTLRARWVGIRTAHPELFDGLRPVVTLKQLSRSNRVELRLVAGPLGSADVATQLCAYLAPYRLYCRPTIFSGQHLALE
jgi:hypothetical protein